MELDKHIELPGFGGRFPYTIVGTEELHSKFLFRSTNDGDYHHSPYRFRDLDYSYQQWLRNHFVDENDMELFSSDSRLDYTPYAYSHAIVIDLLAGHDSWHDAFNADVDHFVKLYNLWYKLIGDVIPNWVSDTHASSYGASHSELQQIISEMYCDQDYSDLPRPLTSGESLSHQNYNPGYYGGHRSNVFLQILKSTFSVPDYAWPSGIDFYKEENGEDVWTTGLFRRNIFRNTEAASYWKTFPMRYLYIPLPSDTVMYYTYVRSNSYRNNFATHHIGWSNDLNSLAVKRCYTSYGYSSTLNDQEGHMQFYDYHQKNFVNDKQNLGRQYKECLHCRKYFNTHWMTWYKAVGGYSNGSRSRICFMCAMMLTSSYNVDNKCFVTYPNEPTDGTRYGYIGMQDDHYVQYMHGDDLPRARGSRQYQWEMIDDESWQSVDDLDLLPNNVNSLPVDARKFLTWVKESFAHASTDEKTAIVTELRREYIVGYDSEHGSQNNWEDAEGHCINTASTDEAIGSSENEELSTLDYIKWKGLHLPVVKMYAVNDDLVSSVISLRIDSRDDARTFYTYQPGGHRRSSGSEETRTADDGWLVPHNMDPGNMVLEKMNYSFSPNYNYVNYRNGEFRYFPVSGMQPCSPQDACECGLHETSVSHAEDYRWHYRNGLFMGLELELVIRDERLLSESGYNEVIARTLHTFHNDDMGKQLLYAKRDGSLPSGTGVEYITFPMTLEAYQAIPEMFWNLVESNYKAFGLDDVGIHIHFPWASMNLQHAYAMLSALNTLQINPHGLLLYIAQRTTGQWARWDLLQYRDTYNTVAEVAKNRTRADNDKYKGINMQHDHTIELRYFKSNAKSNRILKNLEFLDALYEMTKADVDGQEWDSDRDVPSNSLIDIVAAYSNTSSKYKVDNVHNDAVPFAHYIEHKLVQYVLADGDRYPNLHDFLLGLTANEEPRTFVLSDIGVFDNVEEEPEEEIVETEDYFPTKTAFFVGAERITVQGTTYTVNSTIFMDGEDS